MSITHWPLNERPREKLLLFGAKNLSDAELLAIFVNTGVPGKTALDIARELLINFGSLKKLLQSYPHEIYSQRGLGKAKYALLQAALELGRRFLDSEIQIGEALLDSHLTRRFLTNQMKNHSQEVFACLFLDNHNRLIYFEELFRGTLTEASVYPREVVKRALRHNAAKVIFAHNHPSGNATPSQADQELTQQLKKALALIDTIVVDHFVIGQNETVSFAELGLI
ncbi:MAG TPA: DNA repair protein RadC [Gammaproteobacteria bacterium]|nr:DNA repair protein RadC [Gammaproteobacteria bacterium]